MKNVLKVLLFVALLCYNEIQAQYVYVEYSVVSNFDFGQNTPSGINKQEYMPYIQKFEKASELLNEMTMHLKANKTKSVYWGENKMSSDYNPELYTIAKIMLHSDDKYYIDLKTNTISKWFNMMGQNFIETTSINDLKWEMTNESKDINGFLCYKAITNYTVKNEVGEFEKSVEAWYSPTIPFRFGPKTFAGLPGLILELKDDKITYFAKNIILKKEDIEIEQIPKGKHITQEELNQALRKFHR